ncbi:PQQ-binding-like beta-propeller repeat protein [Cytophagaceae bacterium DM2B3-1]|uniref:PQQ-binding-like beta-propeller repeat protein n=1 Tax=Xanthocytophaga flava TaxID=3048013 RepID=A0ABT7CWD2_9BACT|nr:PQQ-binding-like beta-propeller repeat protein [Xanthocytophaga flavus]MDJ1472534.1 PQQ-binding-like beta-propeller repeat protein [Xanthocytophaga flavus]MDJ1497242.1 PQQ-binding-like beta-propeller repeat protein [Xanthocytophaga flavus]
MEPQLIEYKKPFIQFNNLSGEQLLFDVFNKRVIKPIYPIAIKSLFENRAICSYDMYFDNDEGSWVWNIGLFDIEKQELIRKFKTGPIGVGYMYNEICFGYSKNNVLISFDLNTGKILWQIDIGKKCKYNFANQNYSGQTSQFLDIFDAKLYCWCHGNQLLEIDIETGAINWHFYPFNDFLDSNQVQLFQPHLDSEKRKIYFLESCYFIEIDLNNRNSILHQTFRQGTGIDSSQWFRLSSVYQNGLIYFIGNQNDYPMNPLRQVGVFDTVSQKIIWSQVLFEKGKGLNLVNIKANQDQIYVQDNKSTLYSFERE